MRSFDAVAAEYVPESVPRLPLLTTNSSDHNGEHDLQALHLVGEFPERVSAGPDLEADTVRASGWRSGKDSIQVKASLPGRRIPKGFKGTDGNGT
jgi:hypothetical protein